MSRDNASTPTIQSSPHFSDLRSLGKLCTVKEILIVMLKLSEYMSVKPTLLTQIFEKGQACPKRATCVRSVQNSTLVARLGHACHGNFPLPPMNAMDSLFNGQSVGIRSLSAAQIVQYSLFWEIGKRKSAIEGYNTGRPSTVGKSHYHMCHKHCDFEQISVRLLGYNYRSDNIRKGRGITRHEKDA